MAHWRKKAAEGFTLIELAVVTVILGVLLAVLRPSIGLTQSAAIADQMERIADAGTENWLILAAAAQINPAQPGALIASNYYMTDAIFQGLPAIAPAYQAIYKSTDIKPLNYLAVPMPGASGNGTYVLKALPNIQLGMGWQVTTGTIDFTFSYTPVEVTQLLVDRIQTGTTLNMGNNMYYVGPTLFYNCNFVNYCTVHMIRKVIQ
ncbi:type II secretion system protein [Noviherbaspirillum pedocola]|uniref:Type II secretion system protein n=1 Tax=Noviherbaspirillum pedocola TaxID=2801341 RepID=A0A934SSG5_9BURK|nr:type II secretion system protein [Noviherbaspirillum pedocola]MBK4735931.1 type II secretion system protein [Noviherbaspirillum pedocola]